MKNVDDQIEINSGSDNENSSADNIRRKFLVRSAATATVLVAGLPVKASATHWSGSSSASGCMVSGTLSGNQSAACESTAVTGQSPYKWKQACDDKNRYKHHSNYSSGGASSYEDATWGSVFSYSPSGHRVNMNSTLYQVLSSGADVDKHLVAGYLNAAYGYYPLSAGVSAKDYARMLEQEAMSNESALIAALEQTYTQG